MDWDDSSLTHNMLDGRYVKDCDSDIIDIYLEMGYSTVNTSTPMTITAGERIILIVCDGQLVCPHDRG